MAQAGLNLGIHLASRHTYCWASRPTGEQDTKSSNKPYPVVKNIYYIIHSVSKNVPSLACYNFDYAMFGQ